MCSALSDVLSVEFSIRRQTKSRCAEVFAQQSMAMYTAMNTQKVKYTHTYTHTALMRLLFDNFLFFFFAFLLTLVFFSFDRSQS